MPGQKMQYIILFTAVSMLAAASNRFLAAEQTPVQTDSDQTASSEKNCDKTTVSIFNDQGSPVLRYRHSGYPMKPYIDRLYTPAGVQILRDSPHDHKHHHGLMFALTADGVDFWSESPDKNGRQVQQELSEVKVAEKNGLRSTKFSQKLNWIGPKSEEPLIIENRTVTVYRRQDMDATLLEWRLCLETPPGKKSVLLSGRHFSGLGMRFVESMDRVGRFFNAADRLGPIFRKEERLTPVKWCAYSAEADGKPVTVAMFDHPSNLRHPATMFTMPKSFAYISATLNVWKDTLEITPDRPLKLRYGIAAWDGSVDKETAERLYKLWCEISP